MKLILLIDIDEEKYNLDDLFLEYHIYDYRRDTEVRDYEKCGLRLLPKKISDKSPLYNRGWNDFRDEIIGRIK